MWQAVPITNELYGFQPEENRHEAWAATSHVQQKNDQLDISTDIHMSYVSNKEEYESLIDTIRYFADIQKRQSGTEKCVLHFRCKGTSHFDEDHPLPVTSHASGHSMFDAEFSEELV